MSKLYLGLCSLTAWRAMTIAPLSPCRAIRVFTPEPTSEASSSAPTCPVLVPCWKLHPLSEARITLTPIYTGMNVTTQPGRPPPQFITLIAYTVTDFARYTPSCKATGSERWLPVLALSRIEAFYGWLVCRVSPRLKERAIYCATAQCNIGMDVCARYPSREWYAQWLAKSISLVRVTWAVVDQRAS